MVQLCHMRNAYEKPTTQIASCKSNLQLAYDYHIQQQKNVIGFWNMFYSQNSSSIPTKGELANSLSFIESLFQARKHFPAAFLLTGEVLVLSIPNIVLRISWYIKTIPQLMMLYLLYIQAWQNV